MSHAIPHLNAALQQALTSLQAAATQQPETLAHLQSRHAVSFAALSEAVQQFQAILPCAQADASRVGLDSTEVSQLGEHGLQLLYTLEAWSKALKLNRSEIQAAILMLVAWIGRNQGIVEGQEALVNCLAEFANQTQDSQTLSTLCQIIPLMFATAPMVIKQDLEKMNPGRPWRLLHMNYAIIATRSHDPTLMDAAFQRLVTHFPEAAKAFFTEGMRQMELVGYPPSVREVMARYYTLCNAQSSLH